MKNKQTKSKKLNSIFESILKETSDIRKKLLREEIDAELITPLKNAQRAGNKEEVARLLKVGIEKYGKENLKDFMSYTANKDELLKAKADGGIKNVSKLNNDLERSALDSIRTKSSTGDLDLGSDFESDFGAFLDKSSKNFNAKSDADIEKIFGKEKPSNTNVSKNNISSKTNTQVDHISDDEIDSLWSDKEDSVIRKIAESVRSKVNETFTGSFVFTATNALNNKNKKDLAKCVATAYKKYGKEKTLTGLKEAIELSQKQVLREGKGKKKNYFFESYKQLTEIVSNELIDQLVHAMSTGKQQEVQRVIAQARGEHSPQTIRNAIAQANVIAQMNSEEEVRAASGESFGKLVAEKFFQNLIAEQIVKKLSTEGRLFEAIEDINKLFGSPKNINNIIAAKKQSNTLAAKNKEPSDETKNLLGGIHKDLAAKTKEPSDETKSLLGKIEKDFAAKGKKLPPPVPADAKKLRKIAERKEALSKLIENLINKELRKKLSV